MKEDKIKEKRIKEVLALIDHSPEEEVRIFMSVLLLDNPYLIEEFKKFMKSRKKLVINEKYFDKDETDEIFDPDNLSVFYNFYHNKLGAMIDEEGYLDEKSLPDYFYMVEDLLNDEMLFDSKVELLDNIMTVLDSIFEDFYGDSKVFFKYIQDLKHRIDVLIDGSDYDDQVEMLDYLENKIEEKGFIYDLPIEYQFFRDHFKDSIFYLGKIRFLSRLLRQIEIGRHGGVVIESPLFLDCINVMRENHRPEDMISQFVSGHLNFLDARMMKIEELINHGQYKTAEKLIEELRIFILSQEYYDKLDEYMERIKNSRD